MPISILLCVHNGERFVRDAVLSLLAQTYKDFELSVVDDASTDGTAEILADFAKVDPRVRIVTNETNLGLTKSLNIALATVGKRDPSSAKWPPQDDTCYIARMDADDVALPDRLKKQIAFLETHPEVNMVGTAYEWIDEQGNVIGHPNVITEPDVLHHALIRTNPFLHGSVMMRRSVIEQANGYDESYRRAQDYELWLRLSRNNRFANLPEILMQKRMTKNMISFKSERAQIQFALRARFAALKRGDYPLWCAVYLIKPFLATILPTRVVRWARVHLFGQRVYAHHSLK